MGRALSISLCVFGISCVDLVFPRLLFQGRKRGTLEATVEVVVVYVVDEELRGGLGANFPCCADGRHHPPPRKRRL